MRRLSLLPGVFFVVLALAVGCASPKEVAVVTERPSAPTEGVRPRTPEGLRTLGSRKTEVLVLENSQEKLRSVILKCAGVS